MTQPNSLRILFVGYADSIHTARWTAQLEGLGWDLHLFGSTHAKPNRELRGVTVHRLLESPLSRASVTQKAIQWPLPRGETRVATMLERMDRFSAPARLARLIDELRPDIVHSLEMQLGGYLTSQARQRCVSPFPTWIYSSWGSDLFYFGRIPQHQQRIRDVLTHCDYLITDCHRDVQLAREHGFDGELLGIYPVGGGFELAKMRAFRQAGSVASRRVIAVKGYNGGQFEARGLVAIEALGQCAPLLQDYEVVVFSATQEVADAVEHLKGTCGVQARVLLQSLHSDILRLMGRSRIAIGLGMSDGSPNTLLEAMIMGAFPIQSDTISTGEWIESGKNGFLVPPEDPNAVAAAIRRALSDSALVEGSAEINTRIADERLDREHIRREVVSLYERVATVSEFHTARVSGSTK
jgi:Glycosyl transferase 4-like/Glycosyl transferases group 1